MGRKKSRKRNKTFSGSTGGGAPSAPSSSPARSVPPSSKTMQRIGRGAAVVVGLVFILAGTMKVADPWTFLGSLPAYGIPSAVRLPVTVVMPMIEMVLGVMLVAGWRLRHASIATAAFLVAFGGVIAYGWSAGTLQECGCFGPLLQRTPPQALAQDAGLLALAVLGMVWAPIDPKPMSRGRWGTLATVAVVSVALIGSALLGDRATLEERIAAAEPAIDTTAGSLADLDLRSRDVFLYLFHPNCPHCIENGPAIKRINEDPDLPDVIGITHSVRGGDVRGYQRGAATQFPAYTFTVPSFIQITGDGAVPQLVYLRRGRVTKVWKGNLPTPDELERYLAGT